MTPLYGKEIFYLNTLLMIAEYQTGKTNLPLY